jgi:hypothetical protein
MMKFYQKYLKEPEALEAKTDQESKKRPLKPDTAESSSKRRHVEPSHAVDAQPNADVQALKSQAKLLAAKLDERLSNDIREALVASYDYAIGNVAWHCLLLCWQQTS